MKHDIILRNGIIIDGTGALRFAVLRPLSR
jgi:N-acyl-D-aspartate/D-glutamate deacylase